MRVNHGSDAGPQTRRRTLEARPPRRSGLRLERVERVLPTSRHQWSRPATMRRWNSSTAMRSGTVTITPAPMIVP